MISNDITDKDLIGKVVTLDIEQLWKTACPDPDIYTGLKGTIKSKEVNIMTFYGYFNVAMENGHNLLLQREEMNLFES